MTIKRSQLDDFYSALLKPHIFSDYGPNGLQIEGADHIHTIAFAVSATLDSITRAVNYNADTLVVHHGLFWKFHGCRTLTGSFGKRVRPLVQQQMNLFAYHLPLDAHPKIGNAAQLGKRLLLEEQQAFGDYKGCPTGVQGKLTTGQTAKQLKQNLSDLLNHPVILASPDDSAIIQSLGIITGGANSDWHLAVRAGLDAYITGEISEHDWHDSQEAGIHMYAGGHHATERFGIQALMQATQEQFDIDCIFIDSDNPA
jgi:dinuclear metal center YbgI/SA1388 family protein